MRCKQWTCPYCGTKNADMWRAHLLHTFCEVMTEKQWVFVTLTAKPKDHSSPEQSLKALKAGWGKIYDALRYRYGRKFSYVMVYEAHKSGAYHIHILIDLGAEYDSMGAAPEGIEPYGALIKAERRHPFCKALKAAAVKAKIGYIVHARRIKEGASGADNARLAVGYVTKYFVKQSEMLNFPKHARRIGTSRDIGSPATANKGKFSWRIRSFVEWAETRAIPHLLIQEGRMLNASDFGDEGVYPASSDD